MTRFALVNGHVIVRAGALNLLIDTGSPLSIGRPEAVRLGSLEVLPSLSPWLDLWSLERLVGVRVDVLVGNDVLGGAAWELDFGQGVLATSFASRDPGAVVRFAASALGGLPVTEAVIEGRPVRALVDTGAPCSYVLPEVVAEAPVVGSMTDFSPAVAGLHFESALVDAPVRVFDRVLALRLGRLTQPDVAAMLSLAGASAILGVDALRTLGRVRFVPR